MQTSALSRSPFNTTFCTWETRGKQTQEGRFLAVIASMGFGLTPIFMCEEGLRGFHCTGMPGSGGLCPFPISSTAGNMVVVPPLLKT